MATDEVTLKDVFDIVNALDKKLEERFVTKDRFKPVEKLVYGLVALILVAVFGALLAVVIPNTTRTNAVTTSQPIK